MFMSWSFLSFVPRIAHASEAKAVHFFFSEECDICYQELDKLKEIVEKEPGLYIRTYEIGKDTQNLEILFYLLDQYGKKDLDFAIPIVFIGDDVLIGRPGLSTGLKAAVADASTLKYDRPASLIEDFGGKDPGINPYITLPAVMVSALIDSINPCAIAVILFLLSAIVLNKDKRKAVTYGSIYIGTIFLVYLGLGLGIIYFLESIRIPSLLLLVIGSVLVIAGLVSIKEYFWQGRGPQLGIPSPIKKIIEKNIQKATILSMILIGILISVFEATCSGAIYLGVLSLIATRGLNIRTGGLLVLYNFIFIMPLLAILAIFYLGLPIKKLNRWLIQKRRKTYRLMAGFILIFLGIYIIIFFKGGL